MNIITSNPIIYNGKNESNCDLYIPFDGKKASKDTLLAFQKYANKSGFTPKLKEDGVYGKGTQAAIDSGLGKKWDDLNAYIGQTATSGEVKKDEKKKGEKIKEAFKQAKESGLLDKALGLFGLGAKTPAEDSGVSSAPSSIRDEESGKGVQIALIIGGVALVGAIIYFATKEK